MRTFIPIQNSPTCVKIRELLKYCKREFIEEHLTMCSPYKHSASNPIHHLDTLSSTTSSTPWYAH